LSAAAHSAHISKVRVLRVIAITFLTAVAGAVLSVVGSLYLTELYHVSNFEGGRGMLIFFALAPLGFIVGFIIGLIVALRSGGTGFELRSDSRRLLQVSSILRRIIHPSLMGNRLRSSSSLRFRRR